MQSHFKFDDDWRNTKEYKKGKTIQAMGNIFLHKWNATIMVLEG